MKSNMEKNQSNMDENPTRFFKIMFPTPKISQQLQIPTEFVKHIHTHAFKKATFRDCSGHIWEVKLYKNNTGVFVKDGWDRFFEAHSLGHFEFVTFTHHGETCFDVRIYGKDGIEKLQNNGSNGSISSEHPSDVENQSERELVYDAPTCVEIATANERRKRGRPRKSPLLNSQRPLSADKQGKGLRCNEPESSKKPENKELRTETRKVIIDSCDEEPGFRSENFNKTKGINRENTAFFSKFPFFEICIDLSKVYMKNRVNLPYEFVKKYIPKTTTTMVLIDEKGTSVEVTFSYKFKRFYGGWLRFMRESGLKCGDRCIFELISENEMKIYISGSENDK